MTTLLLAARHDVGSQAIGTHCTVVPGPALVAARSDEVVRRLPESCAITDCKSLHGAFEKNESLGLGLSEKRTSMEVTATRQQMRATGIQTRRVHSDRQLADVLTKPIASPISIQRLQHTGRWKIVWDATYTSAKNLRQTKRDNHFKNQQAKESVDSFAQEHINLVVDVTPSLPAMSGSEPLAVNQPEDTIDQGYLHVQNRHDLNYQNHYHNNHLNHSPHNDTGDDNK